MRKLFSAGVVVATVFAAFAPLVVASPVQAATNTVVQLGFDDGFGDQALAATALAAHGMHGTFYVNSNTIGTPGYLTWAQLTAFQTAGNEIAGHTLDHLNLTTIPLDQAELQVCQDRAATMSHGLTVTDFAYPYGDGFEVPAVKAIPAACGYNSARRAWGLYSSDPVCGTTGCGYPYAESIPPSDPYAVLTADNPQTATTLAQIETLVTQAETHGGGFVPLVFHDICAACQPYSVTQATLTAFLDWLQPRAASGTVVKTMAQVIGGAVQPADVTAPVSTISCNALPCTTSYYLPTAPITLAATDVGGWGVNQIRYTTNGTDPTPTSTAYTVPLTFAATTTLKYRAYDNANNAEAVKTQVINVDGAAPTSSISCNGTPCTSAPYAAPVTVGLSSVDAGGAGLAAIRYTTDGSVPTLASPLYGSALAVSSTTTVSYRGWDNAGNIEATKSQVVHVDTNAPVSAIACNSAACGSGWYNAPVQVSLAATDTGGGSVAAIRYTTDGSDPSLASSTYSTPLTVSAATTIKYRAWDSVGNVEPTNTRVIQLDSTPPISSITCNGVSCAGGWYAGAVQVSLAAADTGGSGVSSTHFTTDGSDPTLASPIYAGPFTVSANTTIKYRSWDGAGNAEATTSRALSIDAVAPVSAITCNGRTCGTGWSRSAVHVALSATDAGGSSLASVRYTTDGSNPTPASPIYSGPLTLSASKWVRVRAYDNAGNAGPIKAAHVQIDTDKPTVAITAPGNNGSVHGNVKISARATDTKSGVAHVFFYVDGKLVGTDTTSAYSFMWNSGHASKRAHTVTAKVFDVCGNSNSKSITVTVH